MNLVLTSQVIGHMVILYVKHMTCNSKTDVLKFWMTTKLSLKEEKKSN